MKKIRIWLYFKIKYLKRIVYSVKTLDIRLLDILKLNKKDIFMLYKRYYIQPTIPDRYLKLLASWCYITYKKNLMQDLLQNKITYTYQIFNEYVIKLYRNEK